MLYSAAVSSDPVRSSVTVACEVTRKLRHNCRRQRFHHLECIYQLCNHRVTPLRLQQQETSAEQVAAAPRLFGVPLREAGPDLVVSKPAIFARRAFS